METRHEFWMEERTGAIWAVEVTGHTLTGCYGPLVLDEVDEDMLDGFAYQAGGVEWIRANEHHFTTHVPLIPYIPPT
jgi:hypothetical protein